MVNPPLKPPAKRAKAQLLCTAECDDFVARKTNAPCQHNRRPAENLVWQPWRCRGPRASNVARPGECKRPPVEDLGGVARSRRGSRQRGMPAFFGAPAPAAGKLGWPQCLPRLRGSMWKLFLEQADVDPGEIEVVEATPFNYFQVLIKFDKIQEAWKHFPPPQGCWLELYCSNGQLNTCTVFKDSGPKRRPIPRNHKFHWASPFTRWNSDSWLMTFTFDGGFVRIILGIFDVCLPVSLLSAAFVLAQEK